MKENWTLFLDRDGVINQHPTEHYVRRWDEFKFCPGALSAIAALRCHFQYIIIVTNQQGIGKKLMTEENLEEIHTKMCHCIGLFGGRIDHVEYCPDLVTLPSHGRKPRPNMALNAQGVFDDITFERSVMVGDQSTDMEFGKNLGMKTFLIQNNQQNATLVDRSLYIEDFTTLNDFSAYVQSHSQEIFHPF